MTGATMSTPTEASIVSYACENMAWATWAMRARGRSRRVPSTSALAG